MSAPDPSQPRPQWRVMCSFCQNTPYPVTREDAKRFLGGYYDLQWAFDQMWNGRRLQTAGHEYWIEKRQPPAPANHELF